MYSFIAVYHIVEEYIDECKSTRGAVVVRLKHMRSVATFIDGRLCSFKLIKPYRQSNSRVQQ
jgi:hypothetical protein